MRAGYILVAGHRRLAAAAATGHADIPALVRAGDADEDLPAALVENLQRRQLGPVEEARAFARALAGRRLTQRRLADLLGLSPALVRERLRLLRLPEAVQERIARAEVPLVLVKRLEEIATVAPEVAAACAGAVARGDVEPGELERRPGNVVARLAELTPEDERPPLAVEVGGYARHRVEDLLLPADPDAELTECAARLGGHVELSDEDADAARAFGCLLEFAEDRYWRRRFITERAFLCDRVRRRLEEAERRAEGQAARERERLTRVLAGGDEGDGAGAPVEGDLEDLAVEARRREREEARAEARSARLANLELGGRLVQDLHAPALGAEAARLLALLVLERDAGAMAARGLRYCLADWQQVAVSTTKVGEQRERVTHLERHQAEERLYARLERAGSPEEILGVVLQALVAAHFADEACVAKSHRTQWSLPGTYGYGVAGRPLNQVPALLEALGGDLLPERLAAQARGRRAERERYSREEAHDEGAQEVDEAGRGEDPGAAAP